jgi:hypothetical protein
MDAALLVVLVTFNKKAVGVPDVFHVCDTDRAEVAVLPASVPGVIATAPVEDTFRCVVLVPPLIVTPYPPLDTVIAADAE